MLAGLIGSSHLAVTIVADIESWVVRKSAVIEGRGEGYSTHQLAEKVSTAPGLKSFFSNNGCVRS